MERPPDHRPLDHPDPPRPEHGLDEVGRAAIADRRSQVHQLDVRLLEVWVVGEEVGEENRSEGRGEEHVPPPVSEPHHGHALQAVQPGEGDVEWPRVVDGVVDCDIQVGQVSHLAEFLDAGGWTSVDVDLLDGEAGEARQVDGEQPEGLALAEHEGDGEAAQFRTAGCEQSDHLG